MFHPAESALNQFADRELPEAQRQRLAEHLATCSKCRTTVSEIRRLTGQAAVLEDPKIPRDLLWRILHATTHGDGAILPDPHGLPVPTRRRRWPRWATPLSAAAAVVVLIVSTTSEVVSEASVLTLEPPYPNPGSVHEVHYRTTPNFEFPERVVLRAEVVEAGKRPWDMTRKYLVLDTLIRSKNRDYVGRFQWPAHAVFAELAVESLGGDRVDPSGIDGAPLLLHHGRQPTFESLDQQVRQYFKRGQYERAFEVAQQTVELYPSQPRAWSSLNSLAREVLGVGAIDSLRQAHRPVFSDLAGNSAAHAAPEWVSEMFWLAKLLDDGELINAWRGRLLLDAPQTRYAVQERVLGIMGGLPHLDVDRALRELDALWWTSGLREPIVNQAYYLALRAKRGASAATWGERLIDIQPWARVTVARDLMQFPEARQVAIRALRHARDELRADHQSGRELYHTIEDHTRTQAARIRHISSLLGRALFEDGAVTEAMPYLDDAVQTGWDVDAFGATASVRLVLGDSLGAAELVARTYVDSLAVGNRVVSDRLGRLLAGAEWPEFVTRAKVHMVEQISAQAVLPRPMPDTLTVTDPNGHARYLPDMVSSDIVVIGFVWRFQTDVIARLVNLASLGNRVIAITGDRRETNYADIVTETPDLMWVHDIDAQAARYFATNRTPDFFVVDPVSNMQFRYTSLDEVPRQLATLRQLRATSNRLNLLAP